MPHVPYLPPASRFFARIDRFSCECPACGKIILSNFDTRELPMTLQGGASPSRRRGRIKARPQDQSLKYLVWNPHLQRLRCPFCQKVFSLGLLAYDNSHNKGNPTPNLPPEDTVPTRRQMLELRHASGGGYWTTSEHKPGWHVNLAVDTPCSCPRKGWLASCPVHGDPAQQVSGGS